MSVDGAAAVQLGSPALQGAYRFFPGHVEQFASLVFADPWLPKGEQFKVIGVPSSTAVSASEVELLQARLKGYVKPGNPVTDPTAIRQFMMWGAQEKIVSDLAYLLGLPVAPCALVCAPEGSQMLPILTVSLLTLPQGRKFSERANLIGFDYIEVCRIASAMAVFHTFVMDRDHNANDGNQLIDVLPGSQTALSFYDYSHALTHGWDMDNPCAPNQHEGKVGAFSDSIPFSDLSLTEMVKIISKIEYLSDATISDIVQRIPDAMLSHNIKRCLTAFLLERRLKLRSTMGL